MLSSASCTEVDIDKINLSWYTIYSEVGYG